MKRWKLGAVLAVVLVLLAALPAWAEGDAESIAEAELKAYLSGAQSVTDGTLIDAGYLKMLVRPEVLWMDDSVEVVVYAPGATEIRVNAGYKEHSQKGDFFHRWFYDTANGQTITASACINGTWQGPCAPVTVQRINYGTLDTPVVTAPEGCAALCPFTISWTEVDHANEYDLQIYDLDSGKLVINTEYYDDDEPILEIVGLPAGRYRAVVVPEAYGWDCKEVGIAQFTIADAAPDARVQLSASATEIYGYAEPDTLNPPVNLTVTAEGADAYRLCSADQMWEQTDSNVFEVDVYNEITHFFAYARINGEWYGPSAPVSVRILPHDESMAAMDVSVPEGCMAYRPFTVSWTPVEGTYYYWDIYGLNTGWIAGDYASSDEPSATVQGLPGGQYWFEVEAMHSDMEDSVAKGIVQFTVADTAPDSRVQLTASATEVLEGSEFTLTASAPGATDYRLYNAHGLIDEMPCSEASCEFVEYIYDENRTYYLYAKIDGEWCGPSAPVTVRVKHRPILSAPTTVTAPTSCVANSPMTFTWSAVEHAQTYDWQITYKPNRTHSYTSWYGSTEECTITVEDLQQSGEYEIEVRACAEGYNRSYYAGARFTVAAPPTDPRVQLTASETDVLLNDQVQWTINAEGAQAYRLYKKNSEKYIYQGTSGTYTVDAKETDTYFAYAKIGGKWCGPSELVTMQVTTLGKLDTPAVAMPEGCTRYCPMTVSWPAVSSAEEYSWYFWWRDESGRHSRSGKTDKNTVTFEDLASELSGEGYFSVRASASKGWIDSSSGSIRFTVAEPQPDDRVQLTASATDALSGEAVNLTVTPEGADKYMICSAQGKCYMHSGQNSDNAFTLQVYETDTYYASVCVDGEWYGPSAPVTVQMTILGKLDTPVVTMPESCTAYAPLMVSWDAVENAQTYSWVIYEDGNAIGDGSTSETSAVLDRLTEGQYILRVRAHAAGWDDSDAAELPFTVAPMQADERVQLTANKTETVEYSYVNFTVNAEGADAYRLYSQYRLEKESSNNVFSSYIPYTRFYYAYARIDGVWCGPSELVTVQTRRKEKLGAPVVTAPEGCTAYAPFTISWSAVENAQEYRWSISTRDMNEEMRSGWVWESTVSVSGLPEGQYTLRVHAEATDWYDSDTSEVQFTVAPGQTDERVQLTANKTETVEDSYVNFTVNAEGADAYRLYSQYRLESESSNNVFISYIPYTRFYYAYARIDGVWCGPSELVTVQTRKKEKLGAPVVTAPEGCTAYAPFTISWSAVENAYGYCWSISTQDTNEQMRSGWASEFTTTVGGLPEGQYTLRVYAHATDWYDSDTSEVQFTVAPGQTDERVQFTASKTEVVEGSDVDLTVNATGADAYRLYTVEYGLYDESSDNRFSPTVYSIKTYYAFARIDGVWCGPSELVTVQTRKREKLGAPVVTAPEGCTAYTPFTISWSAVENAQKYYWSVYKQDTTEWVTGGSSSATTMTVGSLPEGQYTLRVHAEAVDWYDSDTIEVQFTVAEVQPDERVQLTVSRTEVVEYSYVNFTVNAEGADAYRLYSVKRGLQGESSNNAFDMSIYSTDIYYAFARIDGVWCGPSEPVTVQTREKKKLDAPVITAPEGCTAYAPFTISWSAVENAQNYGWKIYGQDESESVRSGWDSESTVTVDGLLEGQYTLRVYAYAKDWYDSDTTEVQFTVAEAQPDERVQLTADRTEIIEGSTVEFIVNAAGADAYRLYCVQDGLVRESNNNVIRMTKYSASIKTYYAYARIDGVWCGPSEPITVQTRKWEKLDAPAITTPEGCTAYAPFTISWSAVENAQKYYLRLYTQDTNENMIRRLISELTMTVDGLPEGQYILQVAACADGWYDSDATEVRFTVAEAQTDERVQLTADRTEIIEGSTVEFIVNAAGADAYRLYTAEYGLVSESSDNVFCKQIYSTQIYYAYARIDGVWCGPSEPVFIQVREKEKLNAPAITAPEGCTAYTPFTISWSAVANAQEYRWSISTQDTDKEIRSGWVSESTMTVDGLPEGQYALRVCAEADDWYDSDATEVQFTVAEVQPDDRVQLTADQTEIIEGALVEFTVTAEGADAYRLYTMESGLVSESPDNVFSECIYDPQTYYACARIDGVWYGPSEMVTIEVREMSELDTPVITVPQSVKVNAPFTVSWNAVANAQVYSWSIYTRDTDRWVDGAETEDTAVSIDGLPEGQYEVSVLAYADDWYPSQMGMAQFTVTDEPDQPTVPVYLTASAAQVPHGESVKLTVTAQGADAYRLYRASDVSGEPLMESESNEFPISVTKPERYVATARVNGVWQPMSDPVTVVLTANMALPSAVKQIEAEAFMGSAFTVVQCPQGMTSIGAKAFANCPNLVQVTVPSSVTAIADDAFAGSDVTLCGAEGSYAQQWAQAHGVPWVTKP